MPNSVREADVADVRRNDEDHRYEIWDEDGRAGIAAYHDRGRRRVFVHTEVSDEHEGKGYASDLVREALDDTRAAGRTVVPLCPFVAGWISRHEEYVDLVDQAALDYLDQ